MTSANETIRDRLREIERAFTAFDRGDRNRLYDTRDSLLGLTGAVEKSESSELAELCEVASRLLGIVIMEGGLTEARAVQIVRELLGFIEGQVAVSGAVAEPGGVFHVVNSEKVGDMLVRRGIINPDQLDKALLLQRVSKGRRMGQVLIAMNAVDQRTLDGILGEQKAETRRAETRRGTGAPAAGGPSISMVPPAPIAPIPPAPDGYYPPASPAPPAPAAPLPGPLQLPIENPNVQRAPSPAPEPPEEPKDGLDWLEGS